MTTSITIGAVTFTGAPVGREATHVTSEDGASFYVTADQWLSLTEAAASLSRAERRAEADREEIERLTQHGPWWMQYGLAKLHAEVDQANPNCPIRLALACAGFVRTPVIVETGEAEAIEHEIVRLRRENAELRAATCAKEATP